MFSPTPVNYRAQDGSWQPIDTTLVDAGDSWRTKANSINVAVPKTATGEVAVADADSRVGFSIVGAQDAPATVKGSEATFESVLPGVTATYNALSTGIKESLVVADSTGPATVTFDVSLSPGLSAKAAPGGVVDFVDANGAPLLEFAAPSVSDAAGAEGTVTTSVAPTAGGATVTLSVDKEWWSASDRTWPVTVDPTTTLTGPANTTDCYVSKANPTGTNCTDPTVRVGKVSSTQERNAFIRFPGLTTAIGYDANITEARLSLTATATTTSTSVPLAVNRITKDFTTAVSWNTYDGVNAWTTPGGDYDTTTGAYVDGAGTKASLATPGAVQFFATGLVSDWVNRQKPNYGFVVRATSTVNNTIDFASSESSTAQKPELRVNYSYRVGTRSSYVLDKHPLTDRLSAGVNVASGALVLSANDLSIAGTAGFNLDIGRTYNALLVSDPWSWNVGADVRIDRSDDGSGTYVAGDGDQWTFVKNSDGSFTPPPGLNATLTDDGGGSWTLKFNQSRLQLKFGLRVSQSVLVKQMDRSGNHVDYTYNTTGSVPLLTSIADTQSRTTTVTWTSGQITKITDSTGRHVDYAYTGTRLDSSTDAAGKTTTYLYDAYGRIAWVITPGGRSTIFTYTSSTDATVTSLAQIHHSGTGGAYTTAYNRIPGSPPNGYTLVTDPNANTIRYDYDHRDRVTKVLDGAGREQDKSWTTNDATGTLTDGLGAVSSVGYDTNLNANSATLPKSSGTANPAITNLSFANTAGMNAGIYQPTSSTDAQSNCTAFKYDTSGRLTDSWAGITPTGSGLTRKCDGGTSTLHDTKAYNADGTLDTVTDALGKITDYSYDAVGNLTNTDNPSPIGDVARTPDALSRTSRLVDGKSQQTDYTYDNLDRVTRITYGGDTGCTSTSTCTSFVYDDDGNLTSRTDATGTTSFTYDPVGKLTAKTLPSSRDACSAGGTAMTFDYDPNGNLTTACDSSGTITYSYDAGNFLTGLALPGGTCSGTPSSCIVFTPDAAGRRIKTTFPTTGANKLIETTGYLPSGQIKTIAAKTGATVLTDLNYSYQSGANDQLVTNSVIDQGDGSTTTLYGHDPRNQLTSATATGTYAYTRSWAFDGTGQPHPEEHADHHHLQEQRRRWPLLGLLRNLEQHLRQSTIGGDRVHLRRQRQPHQQRQRLHHDLQRRLQQPRSNARLVHYHQSLGLRVPRLRRCRSGTAHRDHRHPRHHPPRQQPPRPRLGRRRHHNDQLHPHATRRAARPTPQDRRHQHLQLVPQRQDPERDRHRRQRWHPHRHVPLRPLGRNLQRRHHQRHPQPLALRQRLPRPRNQPQIRRPLPLPSARQVEPNRPRPNPTPLRLRQQQPHRQHRPQRTKHLRRYQPWRRRRLC